MKLIDTAPQRILVWFLISVGLVAATSQVPASLAENADQPAAEEAAPAKPAPPAPKPAAPPAADDMTVWELFQAGGPLMWPIVALSIVAVAFAVERVLGLRRRKILPAELVRGLARLSSLKGGFDPRQAYKLCQQHPSTAANVIKALLLRIGRPRAELEQAVAEANEREAARLYHNVRWLNLAFTVAPMLGLLGTVQGMILVFMDAVKTAGPEKAEVMAKGIYMKLVCTFGGLSVAIPAVICAHLFEGRILRMMSEVEDAVLGLLPQLERFEGRVRVSRGQLDQSEGEPARAAPAEDAPAGQPAAAPK